jgi:hypothetical protein
MIERPTLAELRRRVHKDRHREIGNWLARHVARPTAVFGTWVAVRLGLSANQVTLGSLAASGIAALSMATGTRLGFVIGVGLVHLAFWLDRVDGQVARWRGTASLDGVYFDYLMHHAANMGLGFALGYGLSARGGDLRWTAAGFAIALGWTLLSLHNDCRYKAMFQRLKRENMTYRVDGGSGGRPSPPSPWPRRGRGALTWPAYKLCEPHVVLIGLTVLAGLAIGFPTLWLACWKWSVLGMAALAPTLAAGRWARSVVNGSTESEFRRWFQPVADSPSAASAPSGHEPGAAYDERCSKGGRPGNAREAAGSQAG